MYIAPGQGLTTPWDEILMSTGTSCHFGHLLQVSTKSLRSLILYNFFMILYMYIDPGQGRKPPRVQKFYVNRKTLSLYPFIASFKEISFKSDLIQFFHDLIHVYNPGAGGMQPQGDKVIMSTETSCHFGHLLLVSNHRLQYFLKKSIVLPFSHTKA